ncbi:MAG TPA: septal ring lytic transglycosylase RlpA family protein [Gemmatimonadales bacterium]|nr:septal ring lytic transglycosylase RlpA family protein [Gemmatimonadales bacterium]
MRKLAAVGPAALALALAAVVVNDAPAQEHALRGRISWYGPGFDGKRTANGETFYADSMTMAHRTLPFGTRVRVTNLRNRRSVELRVNDRGPWDTTRVADVSEAAARELGIWRRGLGRARLDVLGPAAALSPPARTSPAPPP